MTNIQDKIDAYKRKKAIQKITKGLGTITEDETTIYCHVDERLFKEKCLHGNVYGINLTHFPIYCYGDVYSLRKNIVYIFDGISFYKPLMLHVSTPSGTHNYVKFKNCTFTNKILIGTAENVEFFNNKRLTSKMIFLINNVQNLRFLNDDTLNSTRLFSHDAYIDINCDTLEMCNTEFYSDSQKISVKNLIMNNSDIFSDEKLEIKADKINLEKSEIYSGFELKLNTKECNDFPSVKAEEIIYNELPLFKHNNSYQEIYKLLELRQLLVDTLATIKLAEELYQKEEVSRYRKELENSPLTRRLTKKNT